MSIWSLVSGVEMIPVYALANIWHASSCNHSLIPVPEPSAPIMSLATDNAPIMAPPKAAAVGITLFSSLYILYVPSSQSYCYILGIIAEYTEGRKHTTALDGRPLQGLDP
jgi:hypothetical protein